eukprot:1148856-Pelagomonas_calceolata.AAC.1
MAEIPYVTNHWGTKSQKIIQYGAVGHGGLEWRFGVGEHICREHLKGTPISGLRRPPLENFPHQLRKSSHFGAKDRMTPHHKVPTESSMAGRERRQVQQQEREQDESKNKWSSIQQQEESGTVNLPTEVGHAQQLTAELNLRACGTALGTPRASSTTPARQFHELDIHWLKNYPLTSSTPLRTLSSANNLPPLRKGKKRERLHNSHH